jgi:hypothetical protein
LARIVRWHVQLFVPPPAHTEQSTEPFSWHHLDDFDAELTVD